METMNPQIADGQQLPSKQEIDALLGHLTPDELAELDQLLNAPTGEKITDGNPVAVWYGSHFSVSLLRKRCKIQ